jgi:F-type H+-transporting ATPase subunit b
MAGLIACTWISAQEIHLLGNPLWALGQAEHPLEAEEPDGEHHEGDAHHAAAHGNTNPISADPDLAIWTVVVFLVLLLVLWKFAWGPISESLDKREQGIADDISGAKSMNEEAKQLLVQYQQKLDSAQDEVRAILDEARRDAEQTQKDMIAKAAADTDALRERAHREISTATDAALKTLADRGAELAVDLAGRIVGAELSTEGHARLIEEAVSRFPAGSPSEN